MVENGALNEPSAGIIGKEGDAHGTPRRQDDAVTPIGFPAIIQRMENAQGVAMHMDGLDAGRGVGETEGHRLAASRPEQWRPLKAG